MKVILLHDVRGIGRRLEMKEVSDGYARNFLFPRKLAEPATAVAQKKLEAMKEHHEKEEAELLKRLHEIARSLKNLSLQFELEADPQGSIFGSVNKDAILKSLREHGIVTTERVEIVLDHPIKKVGEYKIPIDLKKGVRSEVTIVLVAKK